MPSRARRVCCCNNSNLYVGDELINLTHNLRRGLAVVSGGLSVTNWCTVNDVIDARNVYLTVGFQDER